MKEEFIETPEPRTVGFEDRDGNHWVLTYEEHISQDTAVQFTVLLADLENITDACLLPGFTLQTDEEFITSGG